MRHVTFPGIMWPDENNRWTILGTGETTNETPGPDLGKCHMCHGTGPPQKGGPPQMKGPMQRRTPTRSPLDIRASTHWVLPPLNEAPLSGAPLSGGPLAWGPLRLSPLKWGLPLKEGGTYTWANL
jgi:hypothetical protein